MMQILLFQTLGALLGLALIDAVQLFPILSLIDSQFLSSHDFNEESLLDMLNHDTNRISNAEFNSEQQNSYIACGPLIELKAKRSQLLSEEGLFDDHVRTVYQSRSNGIGCLLIHSRHSVLTKSSIYKFDKSVSSFWTYIVLSPTLKIRSSVLHYMDSSTHQDKKINFSRHAIDVDGPNPMASYLDIEFSLGAIRSESMRYCLNFPFNHIAN